MVSNRSELSMSRTGIHGGIRRGTAAAAVGAVLVLSTGVQAALAEDAPAPPQDPAAQSSSAATVPAEAAARLGAMRAQWDSREDDRPAAARVPRPGATTLPAVPGALLPAVTASLTTSSLATSSPSPSPTPSAPATADASLTALPLPDLPLPIASGTPLVTAGQTTPSASPTATTSSQTPSPQAPSSQPPSAQEPSSKAPAQSGSPTAPGPGTASAPGIAPAPGSSPTPGASTGAAAAGAVPPPSGILGTGAAASGQAAGTQAGTPGSAVGTGSAEGAAGQAGPADPGATPSPALPTALSINARHSQPNRTPQAAGAPAGTGHSVSSTEPLPGMSGAMVWLGAGLVGVGAAAGLVFLRMRRP